MCFAPQRRAIFGHRDFKKWPESVVFYTFWLTHELRATVACNFAGSKLSKLVRDWCFVHFDLQMCFAPQRRAIFRHQNFKKCSDTVSFWAFWLQMCFAPQWRAIFEHHNVQNCSRTEVFCTVWLANVLRATAACHFWTSELQKWLRDCGALCILTCKCASRHSGVPFFICLLNCYLRTRRFSEAAFRTSGTTNHWKNTAILGVANISRTCSFFLVTLHACGSSFCWLYTRVDLLSADLTSLLCFSTLLTWHLYSAFQLCILSEVRLLNFLR